jgi:hypothetical protein
MHHLLVIRSQSQEECVSVQDSFEIFTSNVWYNGSLTMGRFENDSNKAEPENRDQFHSKWLNYGTGPLTVATTPDVSPNDLDDFFQTGIQKKFIIGSAIEFTRYLNSTPRILSVKPGVYGRKLPNGDWLGVIAEVWKGNAHFSSPIAISLERTEIISYTKLYAFDHVIFLTGLPKAANLSGSLSFLLYPFSAYVWGGTILSFFLIYLTLLVKNQLERRRGQIGYGKYFSFSILNVILRPTLDQTGDTPNLIKKVLKDSLSRYIFATWLLALIVLSSGYKSQVISALLTPFMVTPPKTFLELVRSDYDVSAVLYNESFYGESFRQLQNEIGRGVVQRAKGVTNIAGPEVISKMGFIS